MRRLAGLVAALVVVGGLAAAAPAPASEAETWALIVGIDDYPGSGRDINGGVNDANDVDAALAQLGVDQHHRNNLRNSAASARAVMASINWLVANAGPEDTAVFFFSGHARKSGGRHLLTASDGQTLADTALADALRPLRAGQTWIGLAVCYAGGFDELGGPNRVITAASGPDELAYEHGGYGRTYFVEFTIRRAILQGHARTTTVEGAFAWGKAEQERHHPEQPPMMIYDGHGGDLELRRGPSDQGGGHQSPPPPSGSSGGSGGSGGGSGGSGDGGSGGGQDGGNEGGGGGLIDALCPDEGLISCRD